MERDAASAGAQRDTRALAAFLPSAYGLNPKNISPARRGFYGETWKIHTGGGDYFAKIDFWPCHKESYRASLPIVQYMARRGLAFVPKVIETLRGQLCCAFQGGVLALFAYVPGDLLEDYALEDLYGCLSRVYTLKTDSLALETEDFSDEIVRACANLAREPGLPESAQMALRNANAPSHTMPAVWRSFPPFAKKTGQDFTSHTATRAATSCRMASIFFSWIGIR